MRKFPAPIRNAAAALGKLPAVGPKTALRYVFSLLHLPKHELELLIKSIDSLKSVRTCTVCFAYSETDVCDICTDSQRTNDQLCVISESRDIATMEATSAYKGRYFVLGGTISPIDGRTPETLNVRQLKNRIEHDTNIKEIILAFFNVNVS